MYKQGLSLLGKHGISDMWEIDGFQVVNLDGPIPTEDHLAVQQAGWTNAILSRGNTLRRIHQFAWSYDVQEKGRE